MTIEKSSRTRGPVTVIPRIEVPVEPKGSENFNSTVIITNKFAERRNFTAANSGDNAVHEGLRPGDTLGRYLILEQIGGGGMGLVYKAHDTELNRTVALKILPPHLCRHTDSLNRFRAEAQSQARLNSPHVVTLYLMMELPVGEVLVLEYIEGQTLQQRIHSQGPLTVSEAVGIIEQALVGVEHIHAMGVVHRDLKPSNIFITNDGMVKIMDFGVAKLMDKPETHRHAMVGTLLYIAPEQINGHHTDFRSDIYTMGMSLFEAVTGRLPFERRSDYALMHAHVQENPPRPQQFLRRIPPALEWVILKAIEKDPDRRFSNATEFRHALLKLGLMERRTRLRRLGKDKIAPREMTGLQQEFMRYHLLPAKQPWRGWWVETALLAVAVVMVWNLGLYPFAGQENAGTATAVSNQDAVSKKTAAHQKIPPDQRARSTRSTASQSRTRSTKAKSTVSETPKKDKYQTLRQAWGG